MKRILLFVFTLCATSTIFAQTFTHNGINYKVTSPTTVEVAPNPNFNGDAVIPSSVTNANVDYEVTAIGNNAFLNDPFSSNYYTYENPTGLSSITIPNTVTSIGSWAFNSCYGLSSITIPNSVKSIEFEAFRFCYRLASVSISEGLVSIGNGAFYHCSSLKSLSIPHSVNTIKPGTFFGCTGLTSINIPNSINTIENAAFADCSSLTSAIIPNSVKTIGNQTFINCTSLTSINIPNSVTGIGEEVFAFCSNLKSVTVNWGSPLAINVNVFNGVAITSATLYVPSGTLAAYQTAPVWKEFGTIIEMLPITFTVSNINYKVTSPTTVEVASNVDFVGDAIIPSSVTNASITYEVTGIGGNAFFSCTNLSSIILPESINKISFAAFWSCYNLKSINLPKSLTTIGQDAFYSCTGLTSVTIPNTVTSIGDYAFANCSSLTSVIVNWVSPIVINPNVFGDVPITIGYAPSKILNTYKIKPVVLANTTISSATLYVPIGTLEAYKVAAVWQDFGTILEQNPLPLTLTKLIAKAIATGNQIDWSTSNVVNVKNIILERSGADNNFEYLLTLPVTASEYIDHNPLAGDNYYRLSTIDNDGDTKIYPQIAFVKGFSNEMSFYPNPVSNGVLNVVSGGNKLQSVAIFDLNGKNVVFVNILNSTKNVLVNTQGLVKGVYILEINSEKTKVVKKVVVN